MRFETIDAAVRSLAEDTGDDVFTGELGRAGELLERAWSAVDVRRIAHIERIDVVAADGATATAKVEGWVQIVEQDDAGRTYRHRQTLTGPVRLVREPESWRVVDYVLDGRSRLASLRLDPGVEAAVEGVSARAVLVDLRSAATLVWLDVQNGRAEALELDAAEVAVPRGGRWLPVDAHVFQQAPIPPVGRGLVLVQCPPLDLDVEALRVVVDAPDSEPLDLTIPFVPQFEPPRVLPHSVRLWNLGAAASATIAVGLLAYLVWRGWTTAAAFLLLVVPAWLLFLILHDLARGVRAPARAYVPAGLVIAVPTLLAAGVFLAGREGGPLSCPSRDGPEPRRVANAFLDAVLDDRDAEAGQYVASGGLRQRREITTFEATALGLRRVRPGSCAELRALYGHDGLCIEDASASVGLTCEQRSWKVSAVEGLS